MPRLHIGCGPNRLDGWINIDRDAGPAVDAALDVRQGLPFDDVELIFAEHFIEHLEYREALALLRECRRVLREDGIARFSTPNLDWVWASHYRRILTPEQEIIGCFALNGAFRAWGHKFLYNFETLRATLIDAGFGNVIRCSYGESAHATLRGLERHEQNPDFEGLSHILIVEASGRGPAALPATLEPSRTTYLRDIGVT